MKYGSEKQAYVSDVMSRIKQAESKFKQIKANINLAAQQGDDVGAEKLLENLEKFVGE